jgi:hypothetical protein
MKSILKALAGMEKGMPCGTVVSERVEAGNSCECFSDLPVMRPGLHYGVCVPACFFFGFFPARICVLHAYPLIGENALPVHRIAGRAEDCDMGCPYFPLVQLNSEIFNLVSPYMLARHFALQKVINGIECGIIGGV